MIPSATTHRALDTGWQFRQAGTSEWLPARVPGSNFTDLLANGLIPDPFVRDNEAQLQWIEQADWEYRCAFDLSPADLRADRIDLLFEGLDTFCAVMLNGHPVLSADNMFRAWRIDCGGLLTQGRNELHLLFRSPVRVGTALAARDDFQYPAENDRTEGRISPYVRKAPYHFGWDWGPKYAHSGVWRPVRLEFARRGRIADITHRIVTLDAWRAELDFTIETETWGEAETGGEAPLFVELSCREPGVATIRCPLVDGTARIALVIDAPRRWWPNGLGEAFLYRFDIRLTDSDGACVASATRAVGLRTVEVVNQLDEIGESFFLKVNGRPVFMKGANYIPSDSFPATVTSGRLERLFEDAIAAHFNMLRVWGGGIYESDRFYDLADEHGILIWQDFMFACTLYPSDERFLASVRAEAIDTVRRLRGRASLALWCGNNENGLGIAHWEWPEKFGYSPERFAALLAGDHALFGELLPAIVAEHDPGRFYLPSSPIGHWNDPADDSRGDGHYWGVWHGELPFGTYAERLSRFMSEYGFQSYPLLASIERFTAQEDRHVGSQVLTAHQKHGRGDAIIGRFIREELGEPGTFEQFCYLSQVVQADGLRIAFEAHRRNRPFCMGSLYWQLNDCWPAISWSSIDHYGRWKALHYQAARSFAPVILSIEDQSEGLVLHGVSDQWETVAGELTVELRDLAGTILWRLSRGVTLEGASAKILEHITDLPDDLDRTRAVVIARLSTGGTAIAESRKLLAPCRLIDLSDPQLEVTPIGGNRVRVLAHHFARAVLVEAVAIDDPDHPLNFSDNFLDLMAGEERVIEVRGGRAFDPATLKARSLFDMRRAPGDGDAR